MDSIYGNFTADLKDQSQLYFASENATNSKVWIGGNVEVNVHGTAQTGGFFVTTGNATVVSSLVQENKMLLRVSNNKKGFKICLIIYIF